MNRLDDKSRKLIIEVNMHLGKYKSLIFGLELLSTCASTAVAISADANRNDKLRGNVFVAGRVASINVVPSNRGMSNKMYLLENDHVG